MKPYLERVWVRQLLGLFAFLLLWEGLVRVGVLNPFYLPPPTDVARVLVELFGRGEIWQHLYATFTAAVLGLLAGIGAGALLGFTAALLPVVSELLVPVMVLLNAVPRVILAPLFVIWLGIDLESKVALSFVLVAVVMFFAVYSGIRDVDRRLVERVKTLGGERWLLLRDVYIPSVTVWVLGALKVAVGFAFTGAVVGEFVASSRGIGYLLSFAQSTYNAVLTLALLFLVIAFALALFGLAGLLERRLLRWKYR